METEEFREHLAKAYHDEILGNVVAAALCKRFGPSWDKYEVMKTLSLLEDRTGAAIAPVLRRNNVALAERAAVEENVLPMADQIESWGSLMAFFRDTLPPVVALFERMADVAQQIDKPALDLLYRHEKALLDLACANAGEEASALSAIAGLVGEAEAIAVDAG